MNSRRQSANDNTPITRSYVAFEDHVKQGGAVALAAASEFFMHYDPVFRTLRIIGQRLEALSIPYAVSGGMALVVHGYERTTMDVDVLVTSQGLAQLHEKLEGLGYVAPFAGSKNLRDTTTKVRIKFFLTGQYPGDGKPKPVAFPDPADASEEIDGIRFLRLDRLIELKLASGMTGGVTRLKDLADVVALIQVLHLNQDFADRLHPYTREKYLELWQGVQDSPPSEH